MSRRPGRGSIARSALAIGVLALVGVLVVWPLVELLAVAAEQLGAPLGDDPRLSQAIANTLLVGSTVAVLSGAFGVAGAFITERSNVSGRKWLRLGLLLPILIPPFVSALSWVRAYGPGGLLDDLFSAGLPWIFGPGGVIFVVAVNAAPLAYLLTVAALGTRVESDLERSSRISGAGAPATFRNVTLPLLTPALVGVLALGFVLGINAFGVPIVLGTPGRFRTVTTLIYEELARSARPESFSRATLLATGLVLTALVFVSAAELLLGARITTRSTGGGFGPQVSRRRPRPWVTIGVWAFVALTSILPLVALSLVAMTRGVGLAPTPANWTTANFTDALDLRLIGAMGRSLALAILAATVGVGLGSAVAALRRSKLGRALGVIVLVTFAVPGSTLAVAMILAYGRPLRDTMLLILAAYVAKLWAVGHRSVAGASESIAPQILLAARASGAGPATAARTVLVPLLRPALAAGWVLVFLISFHELTMSSLLYGPGTETLAVAVLNLQQIGDVPVSSALAVILTVPLLLLAIPLLVVGKLPRRVVGTG